MNHSKQVLVVDDSRVSRLMSHQFILSKHADWQVIEAATGEEALEKVKTVSPVLILLDVNMPGMGGMEALHAMRLMTRASGRLPIAMLSADVTPEAKREALEAGFDAFLPKPIEALRLLEEARVLSALKPEEQRRVEGQASRPPRRGCRKPPRWSIPRPWAISRS